MLDSFLNPALDLHIQALIRVSYGFLLLGHLLWTVPHGRRFFLGERWGGYGKDCAAVNCIQNPIAYPFVMAVWLASAISLMTGYLAVWGALANLALGRYFFLHMRWLGVSRGMGAPGFITGWMAQAVFLLEFTTHHAPSLRTLTLLMLQVDFALIMFVAGWYKLKAGYFHDHGMEYGMVNPQWGYWWRWTGSMSPGHWFFTFNNHMAWGGEVAAGLLMLIPATRFWGALFILFSFVYIAANIRLLMLAPMVMLACFLFFAPGTLGAEWLALVPALPASSGPAWQLSPEAVAAMGGFLAAYAILLPVAYGGLFANLYWGRGLPQPWQRLLERYTNFFGLILWRVFSADLTNFFIRIYRQPREGGPRELVSRWGLAGGLRYSHVAEAITVTSLFTTLKYYPSQGALFRERLLRYARTVPCAVDEVLIFEYVSIRKSERFEFLPAAEYRVDCFQDRVEETRLDTRVDVRAATAVSPVHETAGPGTYAPVKAQEKAA